MGKFKFLILIVFALGLFLLLPQKAKAADTDIVINEVMFNPLNTTTGEFIELYNTGSTPVELLGWTIMDKSGTKDVLANFNKDLGQFPGTQIQPKSYALILELDYNNDYTIFLQDFLDENTVILTVGNSTLGNGLNNDIDELTLFNATNQLIDKKVEWSGMDTTWKGYSFERYLDGKWYKSLQSDGTPGAENSILQLKYPTEPQNITPNDLSKFTIGTEITFSWVEEVGINYELQISSDDGFTSLVDKSELELGKYFWRVKAKNQLGEVYNISRTFEIIEPVYSDEVLGLVNFENAIIRQVKVSRIIDGDTIEVTGLESSFSSTIRLLFVDTPEEGEPFYDSATEFTEQLLDQTIDLIISKNKDEQTDNFLYNRTLAVIIYQDKVFNTQLLEQGLASFYDIDNSALIYNAWLEIIQQAQRERIGLWAATGNIILSELLPDPVGIDAEGEWVEIYNPSTERVVLSRFLLDNYLIPSGFIISPQSYYVFYRSKTGVTLNNTGDTVKLFFPGGLLINETSYGPAEEGIARALADGTWRWTTTPTAGGLNIITSPVIEGVGGSSVDEIKIPINDEPIEIKTGDTEKYRDYLVRISGEVTRTSGNTFYIDDGSGEVKVYIQEKTGIDKPKMYTGDTFEIFGIVNLYRGVFRILPQNQADIRLIESVKQILKTSSKSKVVASLAGSIKKVSAAENSLPTQASQKAKTSFWIQMLKVIIGLAIILLIIFLVKIFTIKKEHPVGYDFGNDET